MAASPALFTASLLLYLFLAAAVNSQAAVRDAAAAAAGRAFNLTTTHRPVAAFSFPVDNPAVKCLGDGKPFLVVLNGVQAYIVPVTGLQMKPASLAGEAPSGKPAMQNAGLSRMGSGSLVRSPIKQQQSIGSSWPAQQQQHRMLNGSMAGEQRTASLPGLQGSGQLGAGARPGGGAGAAPPNQR